MTAFPDHLGSLCERTVPNRAETLLMLAAVMVSAGVMMVCVLSDGRDPNEAEVRPEDLKLNLHSSEWRWIELLPAFGTVKAVQVRDEIAGGKRFKSVADIEASIGRIPLEKREQLEGLLRFE
jgi:hypothetical protein